MKLILEIRDQANDTLTISDATEAVAFAPGVGRDYWSHRVRLSDEQAMLGFPKFSTVGIGFAVEDGSWNTNLPYSCPTDQILAHIIDNKGDETIDDADVREAIVMIQLAVIDERTEARRPAFNSAVRLMNNNLTTVPYEMFDQLLTDYEAVIREGVMLRTEVDHLRASAGVVDATFPEASPIPDGSRGFVALLLRLGVPTKDARVLAVDGKYEMRDGADAPIRSLVDETVSYSPSDVVGRIVGLWRVDDDIYALGVAPPELAEDLNLGRLVLGAELDSDAVAGGPQGDPPQLRISSGRVCGAMVRRPEAFAWAS